MSQHRRETPKQFKKKSEEDYQKELEALWKKVEETEEKDVEMREEERNMFEKTKEMEKAIAAQEEKIKIKKRELSDTTNALEKAMREIEDLNVTLNNEKNTKIAREKVSKEIVLSLDEEVNYYALQIIYLTKEVDQLLKKIKKAKSNNGGKGKTSD
ncbi:hypothetical protein GCK72_022311 [Caenorhabditis remanei]|uniref:Uncharacterized protein n=1 Tax=Caenorhabditis remanei TaxID=31234 RepID=A0A6A5FTH6_CAERE|nr:hypothetical protein GCK72_022311 [Caenorhabditis remanei]KAF1745864.1 hypothetical protein GCK72_022311 [Caenorhabditis remanei]